MSQTLVFYNSEIQLSQENKAILKWNKKYSSKYKCSCLELQQKIGKIYSNNLLQEVWKILFFPIL